MNSWRPRPHKRSRKPHLKFAELEVNAASQIAFSRVVVHGLLQTKDYIKANTETNGRHPFFNLPPKEIEERIRHRQWRQSEFDRTQRPLRVLMPETVLHTPMGGREVMRLQLLTLMTQSQRPHIQLRILPLTAIPGVAWLADAHSFDLLELPTCTILSEELIEQDTLLVVHREKRLRRSPDQHRKAEWYRAAFEYMWEAALPEEGSMSLIVHLAEEMCR